MDELVLALVPAHTSLPDALDNILEGTRALVVHSPERPPLLITAGDIMAAMNDAADHELDPSDIPCSTVIPAHAPTLAPTETPESFSSGSSGGVATPFAVAPVPMVKSRYEAIFRENDKRYAIHEFRGDTALVITASERFAAELNTALTICRCVGNPVHTFEPGEIVVVGICNRPHGAKVICTRMGGVV